MVKAFIQLWLNSPGSDPQGLVTLIDQVPHVDWAELTYGTSDGLAQVTAADMIQLGDTVLKINSIEGVERTVTQIVVQHS